MLTLPHDEAAQRLAPSPLARTPTTLLTPPAHTPGIASLAIATSCRRQRASLSLPSLVLVALAVALALTSDANAQAAWPVPLPFDVAGYPSRFVSYSNKSPRDIMLSVVKNVSEDASVGTLLLNFRAEDRANPSYNLS